MELSIIDALLAEVRPPLPPLTRQAKSRIARAVTEKAHADRDGKHVARTTIPLEELRMSLLEAINRELTAMKADGSLVGEIMFLHHSLDVSVRNPAVKLLLSCFRHPFVCLREGLPLNDEEAAALKSQLEGSPFSLSSDTSGVLAAETMKIFRFFFLSGVESLTLVDEEDATPELTREQHETLENIECLMHMRFKKCWVDIPWEGDSALKALVAHRLISPRQPETTIVDVMRANHTNFSRDLAQVFGKKVVLCGDGSTNVEFPERVQNSDGETHLPEKNASFRGPTHDVIVDKHLPTLQKGALAVLVGASGAGKTMAALRTGTNVSDCVLHSTTDNREATTAKCSE